MKAVVLSGGGAKGSYQIGVWKALRKLNIKFNIVTGTSVGSINGALMTQNDYLKAKILWKKLSPEMIFGDKYKDYENEFELYKKYGENIIKNGGMNVSALEKLINKNLNINKFYNSKVNYGLVTLNITTMEPVKLEKKDIPKSKLADYIIASSTCYPAFKIKKINGEEFIDGGFIDYLPINLAIDMGADEIIAVDLKAPGIKIPPKKFIKITTIEPNNEINNFLDFSRKNSKRNITLGYNDTMKVFKKLEGKKYTFKIGTTEKLIKKVRKEYEKILDKIIEDNNSLENITKLINQTEELDQIIISSIENAAEDINLNETKIYNYLTLKFHLKRKIKKFKKKNKILKILNTEIDIYRKLANKEYDEVKKIALLNPIEFLEAICLYTICGEIK